MAYASTSRRSMPMAGMLSTSMQPRSMPVYAPQPQPQQQQARPGTLAAGTAVSVGKYKVTIDRFLSEGGFAHVYLATSEQAIGGTRKHVLKRMLAPDTRTVAQIGKEVEVMKLLKDHPRIVNFIEASCTELSNERGYEIYILMEWCAGGGIIDMMNTRLQNRLTESEILKIFSDTVEAVAHMHYQSPPLIHRDLKVENILLTPPNTYKLCDFGSTVTPLKRIPTAVPEIQALELEINKSTTLQYRAPELVDVWARKGYDEKIDIWALGVLLYKLCYYTTPFEEQGPLAILNAQYKFPPYPAYSNSIKQLIANMLVERAANRPNIYQVHEQVSKLRGVPVKLENKYLNAKSPSSTGASAPSNVPSISSTAPKLPTGPSVSDIASTISPMRRGRPMKAPEPASQPAVIETEPRKIRTGLASLSLKDEQKGFGDSFDDASASAFASEADKELGESSSLFQDLVSPSSSSTAPAAQGADGKVNLDAYSALADSDSLPVSFGGSGRSPPAVATKEPESEKRELPPLQTTTIGPRPASAAAATTPQSSASTIAAARARFENASASDTAASNDKYDRGQQTSPWLLELARRENGYSVRSSPPPLRLQETTFASTGGVDSVDPPSDSVSKTTLSGKGKRPSRDLLGDDEGGLSGVAPSLSTLSTPKAGADATKTDVGSLDSAREKFKPINKRFSMAPGPGPGPGLGLPTANVPAEDRHLDAADRFPTLEQLDATSPSHDSSSQGSDRQKVPAARPNEWTEVVEKPDPAGEESSSDDGDNFSRPFPRATGPSKPTELAGIAAKSDTASAVGERVQSPPAVVAPKPQSVKRQAAISSLVSRYEDDTKSPPPSLSQSSGSDARKAPPPASKKPEGLRRQSSISSTSHDAPTHVSPSALSNGSIKSPPPPIIQPASYTAPSSRPMSSGSAGLPLSPSFNRMPFRPTPPSTASPVRYARPSASLSSYSSSTPPVALPGLASSQTPTGRFSSSSSVSNRPISAKESDDKDEDGSERFAGVASMKSRWESLSRSNGPGPGRQPAQRKEEGVI